MAKSKTVRFNIYLEEEALRVVDAEAEKLGLNRSEFVRIALDEKLSNGAANEGIDTTMRLLRKLLADELNPQFNRMAKMIAKNTKASATGMYLQVVALNNEQGIDAVKAFRDSEASAVNYLMTKE
jgi:metal-responsive CopG/Arc/MetJ family transcriptional regulator